MRYNAKSIVSSVATLQRSGAQAASRAGLPLPPAEWTCPQETHSRMVENQYSALFETIPLGVVYHGPDGRITAANPAAQRILGLGREQLEGRTPFDPVWAAVRDDGSPFPSEEHPAIVALREGREVRNVVMGVTNPQSGQRVWIRANAIPLFAPGAARPGQAYTAFEEITERRLVQQSERHQRRLAEAMRDTIAVLATLHDMDAVMEQILTSAAQVVPYDGAAIFLSEGEGGRLAYTRGFSAEALAALNAYIGRTALSNVRLVCDSGEPYIIRDTRDMERWTRVPGTEWIRSSLGVPIGVRGEVFGVLTLDSATPHRFTERDLEEITAFGNYAGLAVENARRMAHMERAVAERTAELRRSEERWQAAVDGAGDGLWDWDLATGRVHYSRLWKTMLGYREDEIGDTASEWERLVHPDDLAAVWQRIDAHLSGAAPAYESEHRMRLADGSYLWILDRGKVMQWDAGGRPRRFIGTQADINQSKGLEQKLVQQTELLQILMDTALRFINIPVDQLDQGITDALGQVGRFNQADRAYVVRYDFVRGLGRVSHEWCAPGIHTEFDPTYTVPLDFYAGWVERHRRGEAIHIPCTAELPPDEPLRAWLEAEPTQSVITIPLISGADCLGFIGFDAVREQRVWSDVDAALLKLLGELIVNADSRRRSEVLMRETAAQLAESESRLRNARRMARLGDWRYEIAAQQVDLSPEVFRTLGREPAQGKLPLAEVTALIPQEDRAFLDRAIEGALASGAAQEAEFRMRRADGGLIHVLVQCEPAPGAEGAPAALVGTVLDITERKQGEIALQRALEREKELSELKTRFVAVASHELRTPLSIIHAAVETVLAYGARLGEEQSARRLHKVIDQVGHLQTIVEDVLQYSRTQTGQRELRPVERDFGAFCAAIVEDYQSRGDLGGRLRFVPAAGPLPVRIDAARLAQAAGNLIDNAVKYSPPGAAIAITVERRGGDALFGVADQGIGIPAESLPRLFVPFHRAENASTVAGTGLGLTIAKEIVTAHGGELCIESEEGVGTCAAIRIPLAPPFPEGV